MNSAYLSSLISLHLSANILWSSSFRPLPDFLTYHHLLHLHVYGLSRSLFLCTPAPCRTSKNQLNCVSNGKASMTPSDSLCCFYLSCLPLDYIMKTGASKMCAPKSEVCSLNHFPRALDMEHRFAEIK